jgi:hypothetical protein
VAISGNQPVATILLPVNRNDSSFGTVSFCHRRRYVLGGSSRGKEDSVALLTDGEHAVAFGRKHGRQHAMRDGVLFCRAGGVRADTTECTLSWVERFLRAVNCGGRRFRCVGSCCSWVAGAYRDAPQLSQPGTSIDGVTCRMWRDPMCTERCPGPGVGANRSWNDHAMSGGSCTRFAPTMTRFRSHRLRRLRHDTEPHRKRSPQAPWPPTGGVGNTNGVGLQSLDRCTLAADGSGGPDGRLV